jgi:hypothetical protein
MPALLLMTLWVYAEDRDLRMHNMTGLLSHGKQQHRSSHLCTEWDQER